MKILAVDDDPIVLELLQDCLQRDGHRVDTADNGEDALALLRENDARILITDWEMPGLTGPELCRNVRSLDLGRYVFIIMLTSKSGQGNLLEGLRAGADDFLCKPFDPIELSVRLEVARRISALQTRDLLIFTLAKLAESRDSDTGAHLERVRSYCLLLAENMMRRGLGNGEITPEFVQMTYLTSPLHDIGKVGIPDSVLLKPGRLTADEMEVMKSHTTIGAQTLDAALRESPGTDFLVMARDIALAHHEKFDGTGYPHGLVGTQIPLAGRIVALADVYDALRSKRVYKPAASHEEARSTIEDGRGKHFDPAVVDTFVEIEAEFSRIAHELAN